MLLGKCKLKQDTTTHLLEYPKSKTLILSAGRDVKQQDLSFIAAGNAKWCSHFGRHYGNFLQNETDSYHIDPAITLLGIYPKELKIYVHT